MCAAVPSLIRSLDQSISLKRISLTFMNFCHLFNNIFIFSVLLFVINRCCSQFWAKIRPGVWWQLTPPSRPAEQKHWLKASKNFRLFIFNQNLCEKFCKQKIYSCTIFVLSDQDQEILTQLLNFFEKIACQKKVITVLRWQEVGWKWSWLTSKVL